MENFKNASDSTSNIESISQGLSGSAMKDTQAKAWNSEKGEDEWSPRKNKSDPHEALRSASGNDYEGE